MYINENMYPNIHQSNFLINRFSDAKRLNHQPEVISFYNDCKTRLMHPQMWKYIGLLNHKYQITLHNNLGEQINDPVNKGDFIKVRVQTANTQIKDLWFGVESIEQTIESDLSEEAVCITIRETEDPTILINKLSINLAGKCELHLRRLINTISMDIKVFSAQTLENVKNVLDHFRWEMLIKNILLQL